jgi:hypothetical protein
MSSASLRARGAQTTGKRRCSRNNGVTEGFRNSNKN